MAFRQSIVGEFKEKQDPGSLYLSIAKDYLFTFVSYIKNSLENKVFKRSILFTSTDREDKRCLNDNHRIGSWWKFNNCNSTRDAQGLGLDLF